MPNVLRLMSIAAACGLLVVGCVAEDDGTEVEADIGVSVSDSSDDAVGTSDTTVIINNTSDTTVITRTDTVVKEVPAKRNDPPGNQMDISPEERMQIDRWLKANSDSLNQYGDRIDMMYTGGTPLFNESTGERIDKYQYIVRNHPDKPWRSMKQ